MEDESQYFDNDQQWREHAEMRRSSSGSGVRVWSFVFLVSAIVIAGLILCSCGSKPPVTNADTIRALAPIEKPPVDTKPVRAAVRDTRDAVRDTSDALKEIREAAEKAERDVAEAKRLQEQFADAIKFYETNKEVADRFRDLQKEFERLRIRNLGTVGELKHKVYEAESRASKAESLVNGLRDKVDDLEEKVQEKNQEAKGAQKASRVAADALDKSESQVESLKKSLRDAELTVASLRKYQWMFWIAVGWIVVKVIVSLSKWSPQGWIAKLFF